MKNNNLNININVNSKYIPERSIIEDSLFYFMYNVNITNNGTEEVKLLSRHWDIFDALGNLNEIDGKGVIGETPIIKPGENFSYSSFCPLKTEFGKMKGFYTFRNNKGEVFKTAIPEFALIIPNQVN